MNAATKGLLAIACGLFASIFTPAQTVPPRITQAVDNTRLTTLPGNRHPLALPKFDRGPAPANLPMERMLLVLTRSAEQEAALSTLLKQQQDPSSPNYHQWLTPAQFGQQFGPADQDIQTITGWLQSQGFQVNGVAPGRTTIEFAGTAGQVQAAFHTAIHKFVVNGEEYWANADDPQIPIALAPVVAGVNSLHNFPRKPQHHLAGEFNRSQSGVVTPVAPSFTFAGCGGSCYALGPYDFATIYNVLPLWNATPTHIDGTGQTIAIVAETDINPQDVTSFRTMFGLPAPNLNIIHDGPDPGILTDGEETESDLDVEWSGGVAMNATIDLVVSASTNSTTGIDLSAEYIIDNNLAPIMSESYSACELELGTVGNQYFNHLWQQASSEGITVFVATGDNGSADCDDPNATPPAPATFGLAVNGIASTPYNVAAGGTDFNDFTNASTYWNSTNTSPTQASAKGYIPEPTWNDTCTNGIFGASLGFSMVAETNCNNSHLSQYVSVVGASGGKSNCTTSNGQTVSSCSGGYAKPPWQTGAGVPSDGARDIPDVALFSSDGFEKSFYVLCEADQVTAPSCTPGGNFLGVGGTSASAPAFAGIMALVDQETGTRQGNANYVFYQMATQNPNAFNDVTAGTIAMPCATGSPNCVTANGGDAYGVLSGYSASAGYDLATGLGSVNANNLVTQWENVVLNLRSTATTLILSPPTNPIPHDTAVPFNISVAPVTGSGTPTGQVSIVANVGSSGQQDIADFPLSNGAVSSSTSLLPGGQYNVTAHYGGDGTFAAGDSAPVAVNVVLEASNVVLQILTANQSGQPIPFTSGPYGSFVYLRANISGQSGNGTPTGSVNFTDNGNTLAATLTVATTAPSGALKIRSDPSDSGWRSPSVATTLAVIFCLGILLRYRFPARKLRWSTAAAFVLTGSVLLSSGCGGGGSGTGGTSTAAKDPGTPVSTTTVTITIAMNGVQETVPVTLNVQ